MKIKTHYRQAESIIKSKKKRNTSRISEITFKFLFGRYMKYELFHLLKLQEKRKPGKGFIFFEARPSRVFLVKNFNRDLFYFD